MKFIHILAAAGILASSVAVAPAAEAQRYRDGYREYRDGHRDYRRGDRRWDRRHWNRGRHYNARRHQRCWIERRWSGPVRVCRYSYR